MARLTMPRISRWRLTACAFSILLAAGVPLTVRAQQLAIKTALGATGPSGCATLGTAATTTAGSDDAEARRLMSDGQEAALQGDHAAARDAFAKAAARAPGNARVAYYLGREHEALEESAGAVTEYCRYLALSPNAPDADEVRGRIVRLVPASQVARADAARANFQSGVALLRRRQFEAADSVFTAVIRDIPSATEAYYNRGLARAARGDRRPALEDLEKYLELSPNAADRVALRTAMSRFPDRIYAPEQALVSGLIPGFGQMSTGRPLLGVAVLGAVGAGVFFALQQVEKTEEKQFTDPFGNPYTQAVTRIERPHLVLGGALAALLWGGAAYEAMSYARGSRAKAESILRYATLVPLFDPATRAVGFSLSFSLGHQTQQ